MVHKKEELQLRSLVIKCIDYASKNNKDFTVNEIEILEKHLKSLTDYDWYNNRINSLLKGS